MRAFGASLVAVLILLGTGVATAQDRPRVIAVNYALQYFAERLMGDAGEVEFPAPQDADPSFWRPSIADISAIQSADLILLNGAGFATWVDRVSLPRSRIVNTSETLEEQFITTESITHSHGDGGEHSHEGTASYFWLDPTLAIAQAEAIGTAMMERNIADPAAIDERLAALRDDLMTLDIMAQENLVTLSDVPMITTHPRYQYFAERYQLSLSSLEWEAGAMPSDAELENLKKLIEETSAQVLIWEAQPPQAAFDATAALGLQNVVFPPLAQRVEGEDYLQSFASAISALSNL